MLSLNFLLYLFAGIFFGLAAGNVAVRNVNFLALGLLCWVLVPLLETFQKL